MAMRNKRQQGFLTVREDEFARLYAWYGDAPKAAAEAGYAAPSSSATQNLSKPHVKQQIDAYRAEALDELSVLAVCTLRGILLDATAANRDKINASKAVLSERREETKAALGVDPLSVDFNNMSLEEIEAFMAYAKGELDAQERRLAERAKPVVAIKAQTSNVFD